MHAGGGTLDDLISRAHAKGVRIYGATILPFGGNSYYSAAHESVRQQLNTYIKSGVFDGYIDFDAALTDRVQSLSAVSASTPTTEESCGACPAGTL